MDSRLAEQLVEWHNRHPLARRISIFDVHTIGVVALPFMRSGRPAAHIEPGFAPEAATEAAAEPALAGAPADESTAEPANAQPDDRPAEVFAPKPGLGARLRALLPKPGRPGRQPGWPLFNERFINRLSPRRVASFALAHGHSSPPGAADWPQRSIEIDEDLMARTASKAAGAWPVELYLMTAGVDAGPARTRVLMAWGRGHKLLVLGRRCLDPRKVGLALLAPTLIATGAAGLWWALSGTDTAPRAEPAAASAVAPASAASASAPAVAPAASLPIATDAAAASAVPPLAASDAASASASASAASAPVAEPPASQAIATSASGVPFAVATQGFPDIRPRLKPAPVARAASSAAEPDPTKAAASPKPAAKSEEPASASTPKKAPVQASGKGKTTSTADTQAEAATETKSDARSASKDEARSERQPAPSPAPRPATPGKALGEVGSKRSSSGATTPAAAPAPQGRQVALVGPASASKAQAEATLLKMRGLLGQTVRDPDQLQAQVFQTKEGWRPAVWPFSSREQAQLINATLIASGLRTRAVDF